MPLTRLDGDLLHGYYGRPELVLSGERALGTERLKYKTPQSHADPRRVEPWTTIAMRSRVRRGSESTPLAFESAVADLNMEENKNHGIMLAIP